MRRRPSALRALLTGPERFRFDAALRVLMHRLRTGDPGRAVRFRSRPGRAYAAAEVLTVEQAGRGSKPDMTVSLIGLIGAGGVLPRMYETLASESTRRGSAALQDFLDILSQRMVGFFGRSGIKYRLHRAAEIAALTSSAGAGPDQVAASLLALTGYATPGLVERLEAGPDPLLHYAGLFAMRPRSAERLAALIEDWLGRPVTVVQFAGSWLVLPPDQQTALPGLGNGVAWNRLGVDASVGDRAWDIQAGIVLRIGPLDRADFEALLPDQPACRRLVSLIQAFLGLEVGFSINPVLKAEARFPLVLGGTNPPRLGWNAWATLPPPGIGRGDAAEAVFDGRP